MRFRRPPPARRIRRFRRSSRPARINTGKMMPRAEIARGPKRFSTDSSEFGGETISTANGRDGEDPVTGGALLVAFAGDDPGATELISFPNSLTVSEALLRL